MKIELILEEIPIKVDMNVISAFSGRLICYEKSCQFSKLKDFETDCASPCAQKKRYNDPTENNLLYNQIKI